MAYALAAVYHNPNNNETIIFGNNNLNMWVISSYINLEDFIYDVSVYESRAVVPDRRETPYQKKCSQQYVPRE